MLCNQWGFSLLPHILSYIFTPATLNSTLFLPFGKIKGLPIEVSMFYVAVYQNVCRFLYFSHPFRKSFKFLLRSDWFYVKLLYAVIQ